MMLVMIRMPKILLLLLPACLLRFDNPREKPHV